ncbi:MAG: ABC transporter substrate-binding protein [Alphaproteobacteria bacterium]|nr:ABC transporter substrate-binding protein [Alphaproteobacteria bacterium]
MTKKRADWLSMVVALIILGMALAGLFHIGSAAAQAQGSTDASRFIETLAQDAISVLDSRQATFEARREKFLSLLTENFAVEQISRFVVGKHWRRMSPDQRRQYGTLFEDWLVKYYLIRLNGYSDQKVRVIDKRTVGKRDVVVRTHFEGTKIPKTLKVDWRVRQFASGPRIVDVIVEGVSMIILQRADFTAIIDKRGTDGFLQHLQARLSQLVAAHAKTQPGS